MDCQRSSTLLKEIQSSFSVIQKVGNVDIFLQLLIENKFFIVKRLISFKEGLHLSLNHN